MNSLEDRSKVVAVGAASDSRLWERFAWATLALAIACAAVELLAGPGYRWGWWDFRTGIAAIRWAATACAGLFIVALFAALLSRRRHLKRPFSIFGGAAILSLLAAAPPAYLWVQAQRLPRIHDITTDTENPPRYVAVLPLRADARNSTTYDAAVAEQQRKAYPDVVPVMLNLTAPLALKRAEHVARAMGWEIVAVVPEELRIEATATTLLFGFKDDIVIRIAANGSASRVDVRSLSRVGVSDLGVNAQRIRTFAAKLQSSEYK